MCPVHGSGTWAFLWDGCSVCGKVSASQIGAVVSSQIREAAAIPGEMWGHQAVWCWDGAAIWSEGMKYSMKITQSLWLDSSYSYRTGGAIHFVVYPKHAYKKLLSNPKWDTSAAHGKAARPLLHSLAVMVTQP